jgi:hypothetical protein
MYSFSISRTYVWSEACVYWQEVDKTLTVSLLFRWVTNSGNFPFVIKNTFASTWSYTLKIKSSMWNQTRFFALSCGRTSFQRFFQRTILFPLWNPFLLVLFRTNIRRSYIKSKLVGSSRNQWSKNFWFLINGTYVQRRLQWFHVRGTNNLSANGITRVHQRT